MPANEYQFLTEWRVAAPCELLYEILKEGKDYPRWWPEVYLDAQSHPSGRADHVGDRVDFFTKGWLPYRLHWTAEVVRQQRPQHTIEIKATGDFVGRGVWQLTSDGAATRVAFDWRLRADKPLLRWLSPVFKPIFKWGIIIGRWRAALRAYVARQRGARHWTQRHVCEGAAAANDSSRRDENFYVAKPAIIHHRKRRYAIAITHELQ